MTNLVDTVAILGKPYSITRSRLGAITKIYKDQYICNIEALHNIFDDISDKISFITPTRSPAFSFLISYSDKTHHDGVSVDLFSKTKIPTGKQTERVVMSWRIYHLIDEIENELSITIRISNPINPLIFLQAALLKSPADIDNLEFEMGSTCVTVNGAEQNFADEVFLRVQKWIDARYKPHSFFPVHAFYLRHEWKIDQLSLNLFPLMLTCVLAFGSLKYLSQQAFLVSIPINIAIFQIAQNIFKRLAQKMSNWAMSSKHVSLFQLTTGDIDCQTRQAAKAQNSTLKLLASIAFSFIMNITAGIICWWLTK